ncbi:MAG: glycoside hydrolase family 43 protein [Pyrinomonadaceae bacterium]
MERPIFKASKTYLNPVFPRSFPDPFVIKFCGQYYAYGTGLSDDGRVFTVLTSSDLVEWTALGGAMERLVTDAPFYWAPEVTYHNGKFYLYYSVGNETLMEIRVAVSDRPDAGFVDAGQKLTYQDFAIDAHVFEDDDGKYMFYATDFLDHEQIGTGIVIDRMLDPFTLEGRPRPVTRAKYEWQVYDPRRKEKGGVKWHTVEGPFVLKRKGVYYETFSGGNWQNISYGVSFAVTSDLETDDEWEQFSDGEKTLPILRTIPDLVIGPGHSCIIRGPNNRELYCVYHRWVGESRVLGIDRMDFAGGGRIFVIGATSSPQPAPYTPDRAITEELCTESNGYQQVFESPVGDCFLFEVAVRATDRGNGSFGLRLLAGAIDALVLEVDKAAKKLHVRTPEWLETIDLPHDVDLTVFHDLRVEVDHRIVTISIDRLTTRRSITLTLTATDVCLFSQDASATFAGAALTDGFEELFLDDLLELRGWRIHNGAAIVENGVLKLRSDTSNIMRLVKTVARSDEFDYAFNVRVTENTGDAGIVSFGCGTRLVLHPRSVNVSSGVIELPENYRSDEFFQFRMYQKNVIGELYLDGLKLGTLAAVSGNEIEIGVQMAAVELEMVRYTPL